MRTYVSRGNSIRWDKRRAPRNFGLTWESEPEEAAKVIGCSAPVASYVVRSAQRYVRQEPHS